MLFYRIPLDEGNFDVGKDFYREQLVPIEEILDVESEPLFLFYYVFFFFG